VTVPAVRVTVALADALVQNVTIRLRRVTGRISPAHPPDEQAVPGNPAGLHP
jgi:hypothetical protein